MSEMVERVTKAIDEATRFARLQSRPVSGTFIARAAIAAMREPTMDMVEAGQCNERTIVNETIVWHRMIEAALKED